MIDTNVKSKIQMNEITSPISKELAKVNSELKTILNKFNVTSENDIFKLVLKNPDRRIRQAMILLPVKAIGKRNSDTELFRLCAAAEIVYRAINFHDGVNDSGKISRKITGTKKAIDNSFAVLAGDTLHTLALLVISEIFPESLLLDVIRLIEKTGYMKISDEIQRHIFESKESYINSLKNRSSEFMGTFALLGAYVSKANAEEAAVLEKCSYNLGMAYQIIADHENGKTAFENFDPLPFIKYFAEEAKSAISSFRGSAYKKSLLKLIGYFCSYKGKGTHPMRCGHLLSEGNVPF